MNRLRLILKIIFAYVTIAGLVTFSLFICEEAIQTAMFGTWPAKDTKQWNLVLAGADLMAKINFTAKVINYSIGWIQPLAFFSYRSYAKSTDYYVNVTRTQVFVFAPELMVGRHVQADFRPRQIKNLEDGRRLAINGNIGVYVDENQTLDMMQISGYVKKEGGKFIVTQN